MNNANLKLSHLLATNQPDYAPATINRIHTPLMRVQQVTALATNERSQTALYGLTKLAAEFHRQHRLLAKREELTPDQRSQLRRLRQDCITKLQAVNVQLNDQLVEIILR